MLEKSKVMDLIDTLVTYEDDGTDVRFEIDFEELKSQVFDGTIEELKSIVEEYFVENEIDKDHYRF